MDWFPTQLTTVNLSGSRSIEEATAINASGYIATTGAMRIDHELLRNVLLSANGSYEQDGYQQASRTDKRAGGGFSATYLMNEHIGLMLTYDYLKVDLDRHAQDSQLCRQPGHGLADLPVLDSGLRV